MKGLQQTAVSEFDLDAGMNFGNPAHFLGGLRTGLRLREARRNQAQSGQADRS
jgi:hypothetical protein